MPQKCFTMVRGRVMRVTRLDGCGRIDPGECSAITSEGFVSVALTANIQEGESIEVVNAAGKRCVTDTPPPSFSNWGAEVTFCEVNPELYSMMTGNAVVYDPSGNAVGFRVASNIDLTKSGFALETWSNVPNVACSTDGSGGSFGYSLLPFLQGGVVGDWTIENNAVTFTVTGMTTKDGSAWGVGPYNVVPSTAGTNEVQTVAITGSPTGGTFTLNFNGYVTTAIAYNATAAAVQSALEALANLAPGDVTVTGTAPTFTVTFGGAYAAQNVVTLVATHALTGGTTPNVTVTTTTQGVAQAAGPLSQPIGASDHLHVQWTSVTPPTPGCSCLASGPAATGATAGTPGTFTPVGSYAPENFTDLTNGNPIVTASPATAWTTGQHVVLQDNSKAYWNGTAWTVGQAP